ncbi:MAG: filamentous hemagglutinin N-terminal domain-containing protein [Planctomycetota bacterium]|nr:filamentous hemagglutinin N-terminal domain-containing protein [Planctomycetota bacterium]
MRPNNNSAVILGRAAILALIAGAAAGLTTQTTHAGPEGAHVVRGNVSIDRQGANTTIHASDRSIINYRSFNIGAAESVRFVQPSERARVLNRITGGAPTTIDGALYANGRVYLVNPAGVIFGANSIVDAGRIYAAAADISNSDFLRGVNRFTNVSGEITARGLITAEQVHLIGQRIANHGAIVSPAGVVTMSVGDEVLIGDRGGNIYVRITDDQSLVRNASTNSLPAIDNTGAIEAPTGRISLAAGDTLSLAIRNSGSIDASVADGRAGEIDIHAAEVTNSGAIRADAVNGRAGRVAVTSDHSTTLTEGAVVSAAGLEKAHGGEVLIHAFEGDTRVQRGATVNVSGGANSGHAGFAEVSAGDRLGVQGAVLADASDGYKLGTILYDPRDIIIGNLDDGPNADDDLFISVATIEMPGNIFLVADRDIYVTRSIDKNNGGITLTADRDLSFSMANGGFILSPINISADFLEFTAGRTFVNRVLGGPRLFSTVTDVSLAALNGAISVGQISVPAGRTVNWTQSQSLGFAASTPGILADPANTNVNINVTNGSLTFAADAPGDQNFLSLSAFSSGSMNIEDDLNIANDVDLSSNGQINLSADICAGDVVEIHAGMDGAGDLRFLTSGVEICGREVTLAAGNGSGMNLARVDFSSNEPTIRGANGGATRPDLFAVRQDAAIEPGDLLDPSRFAASIEGMTYILESRDSSIAIDDPAAVNRTSLTLISDDQSAITGDLDLIDLTINGPALLAADIATDDFQMYAGPVTLDGDITLAASMLTFDGSVDAAASGGALIADADVLFNDAVGASEALDFITINGMACLAGGEVITTGDQNWNGAVLLKADTLAMSLGDGVITFDSTIDSDAGGPFDLELITGEDGLLVFRDDIGATGALDELSLSTAGQDGIRSIPDRATIFGDVEGDTLSIRADRFTMGRNEKFTTFGALDIQTTGAATLSDLVTTGDMLVSAAEIRLLLRDAATLITSSGATVNDRGLDFVAGGSINFQGPVTLVGAPGAPEPTFASATGTAIGGGLDPFEFTVIDGDLTTESALTFGDTILDQRTIAGGDGPEPPEPIDGNLVDQIPEDPQFQDSVIPEVYDLALIERLQVNARPITTEQATSSFTGRSIYSELPPTPDDFTAPATVSATRLDIDAVRRTVQTYNAIFGVPVSPGGPATPEAIESTERVAAALNASINRYFSLAEAGAFDPAANRDYIANEPAEAAAFAYAQQLSLLLTDLRNMGLTDLEYRQTRDRILAALAYPGVPVPALGQAIEGVPPAPRGQVSAPVEQPTAAS